METMNSIDLWAIPIVQEMFGMMPDLEMNEIIRFCHQNNIAIVIQDEFIKLFHGEKEIASKTIGV